MPKVDYIDVLLEKIEELKDTTIELETHCADLKAIIDQGQFIPDDLVEEIRIYLAAVCIKQKSIYEEYEDLDVGDVPETFCDMEEMLAICRADAEAAEAEAAKVSMFVEENPELLRTEETEFSHEYLTLKTFKVDMGRQLLGRKLECMVEAMESGGYSIEGILAMKHGRRIEIEGATNKLYESGYLKRYTVEGMGTYYSLSERGINAFGEKPTLGFINNYMKYDVAPYRSADDSEMTTNKAMTKLMACETYVRQKLYAPGYRFSVKYVGMGDNYFVQGYPDLRGKKTTWFTGVVTEAQAQFDEMYTMIDENYKRGDRLIVVGITLGQAKETAKWLKQRLGNRVHEGKVYYCQYGQQETVEL